MCYVTPAEHLGLPTEQDVWEGVMAARVAAEAADLARGNRRTWARNEAMARARAAGETERQVMLALDRCRVEKELKALDTGEACAMCGDDCAASVAARYFGLG